MGMLNTLEFGKMNPHEWGFAGTLNIVPQYQFSSNMMGIFGDETCGQADGCDHLCLCFLHSLFTKIIK
jgi:hypothetical protein